MVVGNFHIRRISVIPTENQAPLLIDSHAPEALEVARKGLLVWLQQSFLRWVKEDDSQKNKEWVNGIVEAFQEALAGEL